MKKMNLIFMILLTILILSGCYSESNSEKIEIELIVKGTDTEFWTYVKNGAEAGKQTNQVKLRVTGPTNEKDYKKQYDYMMEAIARKPKAIILAAGDYNLMEKPVKIAQEKGIPVFIIDSKVKGDIWKSFIGTDNYQLGRNLGKETLNRIETEKGQIGLINFVEKSYPAMLREKGVLKELENSGFELLETFYCDSNIELAEKKTYEMIQSNPDLIGIVGLNAQSATGAARALKKSGRTDIFLGGIDCTVEQASYIEEDIVDVVVLQNPYLMGYFAVETVLNFLNGKEVEKEILVDTEVVDINNLFEDKNQQLIYPFN